MVEIKFEWEELVNVEEWADLVEQMAEDKDHITTDDLMTLLPEPEENIDLLDLLLEELARRGVAVVDAAEAEKLEKAVDEKGRAALPEEIVNLSYLQPDDLLSVYLAEMSQARLLSHDEEIALARRIELGSLAEQALMETDYTAGEYARLQGQVEAGQSAREHLAQANTRLVISIAKRYRGYGMPFTDLIQEGNVGLMRAVDRYDPDSGNRFSTYATWWIRQAVTRSLANNGRVIRIPVHTGARMREMSLVSQRLEANQGRRPTSEEIAAEMDESPDKIRQLMQWSRQPLSLEQPFGDEGDAELGDFIEDRDVARPEEVTDLNLLNETLDTLMGGLTTREVRVLRLRYGLDDGQTRTLKQVAIKFGLSRERIRQIEREAMAKIRLVAPRYGLEDFLPER